MRSQKRNGRWRAVCLLCNACARAARKVRLALVKTNERAEDFRVCCAGFAQVGNSLPCRLHNAKLNGLVYRLYLLRPWLNLVAGDLCGFFPRLPDVVVFFSARKFFREMVGKVFVLALISPHGLVLRRRSFLCLHFLHKSLELTLFVQEPGVNNMPLFINAVRHVSEHLPCVIQRYFTAGVFGCADITIHSLVVHLGQDFGLSVR